MAGKNKFMNANQPAWFDGTNINEAAFCEEFLMHHKMIFAHGAFLHQREE